MENLPLLGVDLGDKTVKGLMEDCLSIFPDCAKLGHGRIKELMENLMVAFRLWVERTEESVPASGSVEKVLESRPNALYEIKFSVFTILNILEWYKTNAREDEETVKRVKIIDNFIKDLDIVCRVLIQ